MLKRYMHTLNGLPAFFSEEDGICFASNLVTARYGNILSATSVGQIERERRKDRELRGDAYYAYEHGYTLVYVPEEKEALNDK